MPIPKISLLALTAALLGCSTFSMAQAASISKEKSSENQAQANQKTPPLKVQTKRICDAIKPIALEARIGWETARLKQLQKQVADSVAALKNEEAAARGWVEKRQKMEDAARADVVAIYSKMETESAASQLGVMDETTAAAILEKLNPRISSSILGQMTTDKAARLTKLMSAMPAGAKS